MTPSATEQFKRLSRPQRAVVGLLRDALFAGDNTAILNGFTEDDWEEIHRFATLQGVAAIVFNQLKMHPRFNTMPRNMRIAWDLSNYAVIRKYRYFCRQATAFEKFYTPANLIPVHFKGLALSLLYPHPELRECGDFDFYLFDTTRDASEQDLHASALKGEALAVNAGMNVNTLYPKHGCFDFNGVHVECHRFLLNTHQLCAAADLEPILHRHIRPVQATLPDGGMFHAVTPDFTRIFIPFHAMQHSGTGMRLRHIADWAMTCQAFGNDMPGRDFSPVLFHGASSLSAISDIILGTKINANDNPTLTAQMMHAMLNPERYERLNIEHEILRDYPGRFNKFCRRFRLASQIFPGETGFTRHFINSLKSKIKQTLTK